MYVYPWGKGKGDRNRRSQRKMKTRTGGGAFEERQELGARKGDALMYRVVGRFPDPDEKVKARRAHA